jgi:hypothetical protein
VWSRHFARLTIDSQLSSSFAPVFPHGIPAHLDAMGVVDQAVEDAVGQRGIADLFVPARDRQLRGQNRGSHLVAILTDLPEVAALRLPAKPAPALC